MPGKSKVWLAVVALSFAFSAATAQEAKAQNSSAAAKASEALAEALVAACRRDPEAFARSLTRENAETFAALPESQRRALMQRLVLLTEPGRPLLSSGPEGRTIVRCSSPGMTAVIRFGAERGGDSLTFVPVEVNAQRDTTFGLLRTPDGWKLISVGLVMLDLPELAKEWEKEGRLSPREEELEDVDAAAIGFLRDVHHAVATYRRAFRRLPESLAQLGPAARGEVSPERANLLDEDLAKGRRGGYVFAYRVIEPKEKNEAPSFVLTATPEEYGKTGRWSFFIDEAGTLRGADKQGAVATADDPKLGFK